MFKHKQAAPSSDGIITSEDAKPTKVSDASSHSSRLSKRRAAFALVLIALVSAGAAYVYVATRPPDVVDTSTTGLAETQQQKKYADAYQKGSDMWVDMSLNAALYASSHGACESAYQTLDEVKSAAPKVDTSIVKTQIDGNCKH
jgi:hypothetical protein